MKSKVVFFLILAACAAIHAEDFGMRGQVYPADRDGREQLKDLMRQKEKSGEIEKYWLDYRSKTIDAVKNPSPLGIRSNYLPRSELRDLRFTIPSDFVNEKGLVIAKKGTVIEPLKIQPLVSGLVFIDGRDQKQIDYAIKRGRAEPLKIVLTAGSPYDLRVKYKDAEWWGGKTIPFYFDQRKMIISSLQRLYGIDVNSVPVTLTQRGDKLSIEYGIRP
jgi:conjugal transfer pilus assembly protein TraW